MRGMGVAPTAVTFNTLMDACLARGAPAAVPRLFRALLGAGLAPDAVSYTTLVAAFARLGRPDDAVRRTVHHVLLVFAAFMCLLPRFGGMHM